MHHLKKKENREVHITCYQVVNKPLSSFTHAKDVIKEGTLIIIWFFTVGNVSLCIQKIYLCEIFVSSILFLFLFFAPEQLIVDLSISLMQLSDQPITW